MALYEINGEHRDVTFYSFALPNDMMDGILGDLTETYFFLSDHVETSRDFMEDIDDEDIEHYDLTEYEVDIDKPPFLWIVRCLEKKIVNTAEEFLK